MQPAADVEKARAAPASNVLVGQPCENGSEVYEAGRPAADRAAFSLYSVPMPVFEMPALTAPLPAMRHPVMPFPFSNPVTSYPDVMPVVPTMVARCPYIAVPRRGRDFHPIGRRCDLDVDVVTCRLTGHRDHRRADREQRTDDSSANVHGSSSKIVNAPGVVERRHPCSTGRGRCSQWTGRRLGAFATRQFREKEKDDVL